MLAILTLVTLYFWFPVVKKWLSPARNGRIATVDTEVSPAATHHPAKDLAGASQRGSSVAAAASAKPGARPTWQEVAEGLDRNPLAQSTPPLRAQRDPFGGDAVGRARAEAAAREAEAEVTPEKLGLRLTSTIVGPIRRIAQLNGKIVEQGQTVTVARDGHAYQFELIAVQPRGIVLQREGKQFELRLPLPAGAAAIELSQIGQ